MRPGQFSSFKRRLSFAVRLRFFTTPTHGQLPSKEMSALDVYLQLLNKSYGPHAPEKACYHSVNQEIVAEEFDFIDRTEQAAVVTQWMRERVSARLARKGRNVRDKKINPLIAIAAAPGCGKSAFLAHFPESAAYRDFSPSPIVSAFTFNSGMQITAHDAAHDLGLRILYGAFTAMRQLGSDLTVDWWGFRAKFSSLFPSAHEITACSALEILRQVYGADRRVLLLVDELSKAGKANPAWDDEVVAELCEVLSKNEFADVVVSSLSVPYVKNLLTGSQRPLLYLALPLLLDETLAANEMGVCADAVLRKSGIPDAKIDNFTRNTLRNAHLLASGHPRSLERLLPVLKVDQEGNINGCWDNVIPKVHPRFSVAALLRTIAEDVIRTKCQYELAEQHWKSVLQMVLSCSAVKLDKVVARELVESGEVYLVPMSRRVDSENLQAMVRMDNFLILLNCANDNPSSHDPYAKLVRDLFKDTVFVRKDAKGDVAVLWERAVALTIASRSWSGVGDVFGGGIEVDTPPLSAKVVLNKNDLNKTHLNTILIGDPDRAGFNSRVILKANPEAFLRVVYIQEKVGPDKRTLENIVARTVAYSLNNHLRRPCTKDIPLKDVHIVIYAWMNVGDLDKNTLRGELDNVLKDTKVIAQDKKAFVRDKTLEFLDIHPENMMILDKQKIDHWLIPSLRPIPRLMEAITRSPPEAVV